MTYKIEFLTDWHCGSGLSAGACLDSLVVKDRDGLPFLPGKTLKGLIREAAEDVAYFRSIEDRDLYDSRIAKIREAFGYFNSKDKEDPLGSRALRGSAHFTDAEIPAAEKSAIMENDLQTFLYRAVSSTAIGENGIAKDMSLRRMETVVPCVLEGRILNLPDDADLKEIVTDALRFLKRLGQNRNRGLGRCSFSVIKTEV